MTKMNKSMTSYMNSMCKNMYDLEKIISEQYDKFVKFYWYILPYSDYIEDVRYNFTDASSLDLVLVIDKKRNATKIVKELSNTEIEGYNVDITSKNDEIFLSISK